MAEGKHQKINSDKLPHWKKPGRERDISELRAELDVLGLKIVQVTPDGNCFFRALADQLEGNEDKHEKYRNMVVRFIKEGNWSGHVELQAASLATHSWVT
ncbi:OVARIAN TUMOR DOMAIN-containing deubiquitinating enzyme 7-like isoform X4 [Primulina huaijiensis]|uniref:OVARIAN TUMOR DOMAIN-containing deubiquitinating enzyme 7-like isoform X4 n=1 Tax=Primulina huaijiensis TaxID=1492673 RepID=UPI003CC74DAB